MAEIQNAKVYDLEERTLKFAKDVRLFINKLFKTTGNFEDSKQLIRSSGSVGANYIEANESLGDKDFLMRIKICRKEAKESCFWLNLVDCKDDKELIEHRNKLINETIELRKIFSTILDKKNKFRDFVF